MSLRSLLPVNGVGWVRGAGDRCHESDATLYDFPLATEPSRTATSHHSCTGKFSLNMVKALEIQGRNAAASQDEA